MTRDTAITKAHELTDKLNAALREAEDEGASAYTAQVDVVDLCKAAIVYTSELHEQAYEGNAIAEFQWR